VEEHRQPHQRRVALHDRILAVRAAGGECPYQVMESVAVGRMRFEQTGLDQMLELLLGLLLMLGIGPNADGRPAAASRQPDETVAEPEPGAASNEQTRSRLSRAHVIIVACGVYSVALTVVAVATSRCRRSRRG